MKNRTLLVAMIFVHFLNRQLVQAAKQQKKNVQKTLLLLLTNAIVFYVAKKNLDKLDKIQA